MSSVARPERLEGTDGPRLKRARVAVACQRCKTRKQKCDGKNPSCSNCLSFSAQCIYIIPENRSQSREQYLRSLEQRLGELESTLASYGPQPRPQSAEDSIQRRQSASTNGTNTSPLAEALVASTTVGAAQSVQGREQEVDSQEELETASVNSVTDILRDLSIEASGGYIGASSNITIGRMIGSLVRVKDTPRSIDKHHMSPSSMYEPTSPSVAQNRATLMAGPEICDRLLLAYLKHISLRWPLLRTSFVWMLHSTREVLEDSYHKTILHLVYSIGGRFLETTGQTGSFYPEEHHAAALQHLDLMLELHDLRSIEVLLLLAIHSLRAPTGPGAWTYVGLAMRLCIDLGLHRRMQQRRMASLAENEMRKRVFWTAYCLDRQVSIVLGRPFAISDRDIDAELPLDVNEDVEDAAVLSQVLTASKSVATCPNQPTSMSCFIHLCRLRIIESNIQQSIYRVDSPSSSSTAEVERFIDQLEAWKADMPRHDQCVQKPANFDLQTTIEGYDYYVRPYLCCQRIHNNVCESQMVYFYKCMRFLLHPHLSAQPTNSKFLAKCVEACGGVCETYKRLHQKISVGFSLMALHSVFLAGLTLLYCTWLAPKEVFSIGTSNSMNACSIVLYIIAERWPGAKKYRDVFEDVKQTVMEAIQQSEFQPRRAIKRLRPSLKSTLGTMEKGEEGQTEFEAMVAEMAGETAGATTSSTDDSFEQSRELSNMATGVDFGASGLTPGALGSHWIDSGVDFSSFDVDGFDAGEMQFPME